MYMSLQIRLSSTCCVLKVFGGHLSEFRVNALRCIFLSRNASKCPVHAVVYIVKTVIHSKCDANNHISSEVVLFLGTKVPISTVALSDIFDLVK